MKKICTVGLCFALAASGVIAAQAADTGSLTLKSCDEYLAGTTVVITQKIPLSDLSGVHLSLDYDHSALKLDEITTNFGRASQSETSNSLDWSTLLSSDGVKLGSDDVIASFKFEVLKDIDSSKAFMKMQVVDAFDHNTNDVKYFSKGKIIVDNDFAGKIGDIDDDGVITASDALSILRSSVDLYDLSAIQFLLADINNDKSIDASDALSVLRYSVGLSADKNIDQIINNILSTNTVELK